MKTWKKNLLEQVLEISEDFDQRDFTEETEAALRETFETKDSDSLLTLISYLCDVIEVYKDEAES